MHYNPKKALIVSGDASPYGVRAVLAQVMEDGSERPVAFASRSLSLAEKKYAQVEKEGLAIVFGVKRFHYYLLSQKFTIRSDHKPSGTFSVKRVQYLQWPRHVSTGGH